MKRVLKCVCIKPIVRFVYVCMYIPSSVFSNIQQRSFSSVLYSYSKRVDFSSARRGADE
jgi:hypothetical protein